MVHTLPVKVNSAMLNIAEQLGIRNAPRNGLRPYRTRNNSGGSSAEETAAGQCRRLAGHGPVSITGRKPEPGVMVGAIDSRPQKTNAHARSCISYDGRFSIIGMSDAVRGSIFQQSLPVLYVGKLTALLLSVNFFVVAPPAFAQGLREDGRTLLRQGQEALDQGNYSGAIELL